MQLDSGMTLETDLLVAADGAVSPVREMMAFSTREWDYGHRAIVTTVQVERSAPGHLPGSDFSHRPTGVPAPAG